MTERKITLTPAATARVQTLLATAPEGVAGLRLDVAEKGCSGLAYQVAYAPSINETDLKLDVGGTTLYITAKAALILYGTIIDYVEEDLYQGFRFNNPQAKGTCGCGESFFI